MHGVSGGLIAQAKAKEASISAVVTRADGRVENLGIISYYHRNPLRRWWWSFTQLFKTRKGA